MIVGGYDLHLYCDYPDESYEHRAIPKGYGSGQFGGDNATQAKREARRFGWRFTRDGQCLCPHCRKMGRKL